MKEFSFSTKFELGQKVFSYSLVKHKIVEFEITRIDFNVGATESDIWYSDFNGFTYHENDCFETKDELFENL